MPRQDVVVGFSRRDSRLTACLPSGTLCDVCGRGGGIAAPSRGGKETSTPFIPRFQKSSSDVFPIKECVQARERWPHTDCNSSGGEQAATNKGGSSTALWNVRRAACVSVVCIHPWRHSREGIDESEGKHDVKRACRLDPQNVCRAAI